MKKELYLWIRNLAVFYIFFTAVLNLVPDKKYEKYFLETLDEMVEQAFDDQCTGANPRYPLMSEIKEMYLKAYYGK